MGTEVEYVKRRTGHGTEAFRRIFSPGSIGGKAVCHVSQTMGKHRSWSMRVDGFRDHVATDGSLPGVAGPWCACGWTVVQLGHDEETGVRGGQSSQPSSVSSEGWIVPPQLMWITKGSSMGLEEENCSALAQKAKDADHVKALRSQHPKGGATKVTFSNQLLREAKNEPANDDAMLDEARWLR